MMMSADELAALLDQVDTKVLGERIKNNRKAVLLTQADLAGEEVTAAYLSRIEDGQRRPSYGLLESIATRLGVSVHYLLTGEKDGQETSPILRETLARVAHLDNEVIELRRRLNQLERVLLDRVVRV